MPSRVVDLTGEPLWAYGFTSPAKPGEKAQAAGAAESQICAPIRTLTNKQGRDVSTGAAPSIRWSTFAMVRTSSTGFPAIIRRCPTSSLTARSRLGAARRGCASCHLPNGHGRPENAAPAALPVAVLRAADRRLPEGPALHGRSAEAEYADDDRPREGDDRRRDPRGRRILRGDQMDAVDPSRRNEPRPEDTHIGQPVPPDHAGPGSSRLPAASSKCLRTRNRRKRIAIRTPGSSRTCLSAASRRARTS